MSRPSGINVYPSQPVTGWLDKAKEIRAAKKELNDHAAEMSEYERRVIRESIQSKTEQYLPEIFNGLKSHLESYKSDYQSKLAAYKKAAQNEITRWDSGKLGTEMHTFQMRIDMALKSVENNPLAKPGNTAALVESLYNEAQASGDMYKQRAASEVAKSLIHYADKMPQDQAVQFRVMVKKADSDLMNIRTTAEIDKTAGEMNQAAAELLAEHKACEGIAIDIGEFDQYSIGVRGGMGDTAKYLRTVQQDRNTGEIKLYPIDAPEVTGISFSINDDGSESIVVGG